MHIASYSPLKILKGGRMLEGSAAKEVFLHGQIEQAEEEEIWQVYAQAERAPVILDEYCWMHVPGNWDCIQCYREQQKEVSS